MNTPPRTFHSTDPHPTPDRPTLSSSSYTFNLSLDTLPSSAESSTDDLYTMSQQGHNGNVAPLPSPTQKDQTQYFGSIAAQQQTQQQQQQQPGTSGRPPSLQGNSNGGGYNASLQNFNLVAEAAKRAQVAVVARELEEVTL